MDTNEMYNLVSKITKDAGKMIREAIKNKKVIEMKSSDIDLVTETDKKVEEYIISNLKSNFPDHKFIGEESVAAGEKACFTDDPTWIIDPVDGTMNFVHGYPFVCISIALYIKKIAEIAIIYNPVYEQFYSARKGQGAFLNNDKITVSNQTEIGKTLLTYECGTSRDENKVKNSITNLSTFLPLVHGTRSTGSCAMNMAHVAQGISDAYFEFGIHTWDIAAGALIVQEAGGVVLDPSGGSLDLMSRRIFCAASQELAEQIIPHISQIFPPRDD